MKNRNMLRGEGRRMRNRGLGEGFGSLQAQEVREGRGRGQGQRRGRGLGQGEGRRAREGGRGMRGRKMYNEELRSMKVAIVTNNEESVAKHIGLAKKIAFYELPSGCLLEVVENPIMQKIKEEHITIEKESEGARHLGVGHTIPAFLKEKGVDVFVTYEFGKGVRDNLLAAGITPLVPENHNIKDIIETLKHNES